MAKDFSKDQDGISRDNSGHNNAEERNKSPTTPHQHEERRQSQFSLAGPSPWNFNNNTYTYVSPEYRQLNPQYNPNSPNEEPVWSLAQPLPHIVRPGMQRGVLPEDRKEDSTHPEAGTLESRTEQEAIDAQQGPAKVATQEQVRADQRGFFNSWCKIRYYLRQPLAEWLGTTLAITLGLGAGLSWTLTNGEMGTFPSQSAAWGFGFMMGIYVAGGVSGGHLNPAISISLSVWRGFPVKLCLSYILMHIIGAITAGGITYAIYHDAIVNAAIQNNVPQNQSPAATILVTAPKPFVHPATAFFTEFLGTAILVGTILALGDDANAPPGAGMQAFIIGILITVLCLAFGYNTGGCFNGARDFGPRLVVVMAGWGGHLFREYHAWWIWGPWVADISGGLFGVFMYDLLIFTGGESPINYPPRRWKRGFLVKEINLRRKLGFGTTKIGDLERGVKDNQD